jgi:Uma2 family endonuclease
VSVAYEHSIGPTTVDDWLAQECPEDGSRLELIFGYLHVSPAPSGRHQYCGDELRGVLRDALRDAGRTDLYAITGIGVRISTSLRTALIPDVVVLNTKPLATCFQAEDLELAVEIWSPGNTRAERETKAAVYASAKVPFFWEVDKDRVGSLTLVTHVLKDDQYVEDLVAKPGTTVTVNAAPVPVTFDPAILHP